MSKVAIDYSLYLVTDQKFCGDQSLERVIEQAVQGGVTVVQLREKQVATEKLTATAKQVKELLDRYGVPLIINDHIDIALAVDASGVHIGQNDTDYQSARKMLGNNKIIGLSVSNLIELQRAETLDVDYLGVGPIFYTSTKPDAAHPLGITQLKNLCTQSRHPLVAIGGIQKTNVTEVMQAGVKGIAVVSAICAATHPKQAAQALKQIIQQVQNEKIC